MKIIENQAGGWEKISVKFPISHGALQSRQAFHKTLLSNSY